MRAGDHSHNADAAAVYFAVDGLSARIDIASAAFLEMLVTTLPADKARIEPRWNKTIKLINKLKGARNKIAHGAMSTWQRNNKRYPRITRPLQNIREVREMLERGQIPGLSANQRR